MKKTIKNKKKSTVQPTEFPGYPLYAPEDDIMHQAKRVEGNLNDELPSATKQGSSDIELDTESNSKETTNEFDITEEDIEALGPKDLSMDMGDDEILKHRITPVDFSAKDLDIPGSELDDAREDIGAEDEENNSYSLGGDKNDDLEGDHT